MFLRLVAVVLRHRATNVHSTPRCTKQGGAHWRVLLKEHGRHEKLKSRCLTLLSLCMCARACVCASAFSFIACVVFACMVFLPGMMLILCPVTSVSWKACGARYKMIHAEANNRPVGGKMIHADATTGPAMGAHRGSYAKSRAETCTLEEEDMRANLTNSLEFPGTLSRRECFRNEGIRIPSIH